MKMKNKRAEQTAAKQRHKERLKARRRTEPNYERPLPKLEKKPTILIVCEGENTEPSYFNQFRLSSATVEPIGEGYNTTSLVSRTLQLVNQGQYDQVWCVFDKDDFSDTDFNNAISMAESNGFGVAYSNQAFEYWLILHFNDHQGGSMHRDEYNKKINTLLQPFNVNYEGDKNKKISEEFFELLNGFDEKTRNKRVDLAIKRAERNYNHHSQTSPAKAESSTTVFRLVKELVKFI
jgi:hypothetical protein